MGLLTEGPKIEEPKFDKEQVIAEIKDGVGIYFPHWSWLTTPDYEFDLVLITGKYVKEVVFHENTKTNLYQIVRGIFVTEDEGTDHVQECNIGQLNIKSARQLFNKLKEYDEGL